MNDESLDLLASCVAANVRDAAHTTNLLLAGKDDQIKRLSRGLLDIEAILDSATVIDRRTEQALRGMAHHFDHAELLLSSMEDNR